MRVVVPLALLALAGCSNMLGPNCGPDQYNDNGRCVYREQQPYTLQQQPQPYQQQPYPGYQAQPAQPYPPRVGQPGTPAPYTKPVPVQP